jgi:putative membrane protein
MWLDALFAYLHFTAAFAFFAFLSVELYLVRSPLDAGRVRELCRADLWYWGCAAAVLATGLARLALGAKGASLHLDAWPFWAKLALFGLAAAMSAAPSAAFRRWRRALGDPRFAVPEAERAGARKRLMATIHVAALIPLLAVLMARGLP